MASWTRKVFLNYFYLRLIYAVLTDLTQDIRIKHGWLIGLTLLSFWLVKGFVNEWLHSRNRRLWAMGAKSLFTSKSATPGKGRRQENRRICLERKNGVLDSYSFQIISQEAGMGGWQQESKLICFKENCILGLGFKLIDCYIWKRWKEVAFANQVELIRTCFGKLQIQSHIVFSQSRFPSQISRGDKIPTHLCCLPCR